jgi:hypothetical protein
MKPEIEKCLKMAQDASDEYITAYTRWYERNLAWEMQVVATMTDGRTAQDAWYLASTRSCGREALALLRSSDIDKEKARYTLKLALCTLRATIDLK